MTAAASTLSPFALWAASKSRQSTLTLSPILTAGYGDGRAPVLHEGHGTKSAIRPVPNLPPGYREPPAHLAARIAGVIASCSRHRAHGQLDN